MAVRITGKEAALYESTTGIAFGPVFEDSLEAEDFLEWYAESGTEDGAYETYAEVDIRKRGQTELQELLTKFREEREEQQS